MQIKTKQETLLKRKQPAVYLVTLIYDKYISWEFCMRVLTTVFHKSDEDAALITQEVLTNGEGICGAYIFEIAETKAFTVETLANKESFSLHCLLEEI